MTNELTSKPKEILSIWDYGNSIEGTLDEDPILALLRKKDLEYSSKVTFEIRRFIHGGLPFWLRNGRVQYLLQDRIIADNEKHKITK